MIAGTFLLTMQDGITKWLTSDFHAGEIMFYRGFWMFPALAEAAQGRRGHELFRLFQTIAQAVHALRIKLAADRFFLQRNGLARGTGAIADTARG